MNCSEFNQLLDAYVDGELDEKQRADLQNHAAGCEECREALSAAEQLRDILSRMDDDISVPLPAQAAWRNAVRAEARRSRMKMIYQACGAVAAVCVLTFGVTTMLTDHSMELSPNVQRIETDGVSVEANLTDTATMRMKRDISGGYVEHIVLVEELEQACGYLNDLVAEYDGSVDQEAEMESGRKVYVQIPGENAADFMSAVNGLGTISEDMTFTMDFSAETVSICVVLASA